MSSRSVYVYRVTVDVELTREDTDQRPTEAAVRNAAIDKLMQGFTLHARLIEESHDVE